MSKDVELLQAVLTHPHADQPRLAYADWLDQQPDPSPRALAQFIRLQCSRHKLLPGSPAEEKLRQQEQQLLSEHAEGWLAPLRQLGVIGQEFERGFLLAARADAQRFCQHASQCFRLAPLLRDLEVANLAPSLESFCKLPQLSHLWWLNLQGNPLTDEGAARLADCPYLTNVREISLADTQLGDDGLLAIVQSPYLTSLELLHCPGNKVTSEGAWALLDVIGQLPLVDVDLTANAIEPEEAQRLERRVWQLVEELDRRLWIHFWPAIS